MATLVLWAMSLSFQPERKDEQNPYQHNWPHWQRKTQNQDQLAVEPITGLNRVGGIFEPILLRRSRVLSVNTGCNYQLVGCFFLFNLCTTKARMSSVKLVKLGRELLLAIRNSSQVERMTFSSEDLPGPELNLPNAGLVGGLKLKNASWETGAKKWLLVLGRL